MANNCCPTDVVDGGTFLDPTIQNPEVYGGVFTAITLAGGVTLGDDATKQQLANQLCEKLETCIKQWVNGNTFVDVTLTQPVVNGGIINGGAIQGAVQLDEAARQFIAEQLSERLCAVMAPCITQLVNSTIDETKIAAVFTNCNGEAHAPGAQLPSCAEVQSQIELAVTSLPVADVVKTLSFNDSERKLYLRTQLTDGTEQVWEVNLSALGGQVSVDGVTIGGTGTAEDPLHVITQDYDGTPSRTIGEELSTDVCGSRTYLLGMPAKWIEFDGYLIPVYSKPVEPTP